MGNYPPQLPLNCRHPVHLELQAKQTVNSLQGEAHHLAAPQLTAYQFPNTLPTPLKHANEASKFHSLQLQTNGMQYLLTPNPPRCQL